MAAQATATLQHLPPLKGGVLGALPLHSIQLEYPDSQLFEGLNFVRGAVFLLSSEKMPGFVLLCNPAGCVSRVHCSVFVVEKNCSDTSCSNSTVRGELSS